MHKESHPLAGETVKVKLRIPHHQLDGLEHEFTIEDWWDKLYGQSWGTSNGNHAAILYSLRLSNADDVSITMSMLDDEVIYGKIGIFGHLIHTSELVSE